ncbi:MAG: acyl-CoA synthetase [Pseudomonadota bacterium]
MLSKAASYEELRSRFRWQLPQRFNIGVAVSDRWAEEDPERIALRYATPGSETQLLTFGDLSVQSNRLANLLRVHGVGPGSRIGVLLPQQPETALAHIAAFKLGAISIPLFMLFGPEALAYRLSDAGVQAVITNREGAAKLAPLRAELADLKLVLCTEEGGEGSESLATGMAAQPPQFTPVDTAAEDPALIIYTSGTTGQPKGALHAHRVLLGHMPGVAMGQDLFPQPGDCFWTPADWAWIGGLLDVLLPSLYEGVPVVACRFAKFTGEATFQLLQDEGIRNAFIPPTALKMMRGVEAPETRWRYRLRSLASGGESLGQELLAWGRKTFDLDINEFYGQTECNLVVSSCGAVMPGRPGLMGRAVPGHAVAVVSPEGDPLPEGQLGTIAVKAPDPVMFLGYWNKPEATQAKYAKGWLLTGDSGIAEGDDWFRFVGRDDDVITSSGYRIGPGEIEDCLLGHPAVALAGVIGKPDPLRTEIVKAYIVLAEGTEASNSLADEIQDWVKTRLAAHEYPREVAFVEALPLTTTGKIIRRELRKRAEAELEEKA